MKTDENSVPGNSGSVWLRRISPNVKGRDFIVGDIHGCLDELISLLAHARFNPKRDRLLSVGDLVDRGPKSAECLNLLEKPWFFAVRGNHEQMLLDHWQNPSDNPAYDPSWLGNVHTDSVQYYTSMLNRLPHVIKIGENPNAFYVMHAEIWDTSQLVTDATIDDFKFAETRQTLAKILWSRHIISNHWKEPGQQFHAPSLSRIFCGHTIVQMPTMIEKSIYLDTGAFAPYIDPENAQGEHYGLSLVETSSLRHWFAPTCNHYRGTVVDMGRLDENNSPSHVVANEIQPQEPF
jgi:serine/threonine protein phosphatase 1